MKRSKEERVIVTSVLSEVKLNENDFLFFAFDLLFFFLLSDVVFSFFEKVIANKVKTLRTTKNTKKKTKKIINK